MIAPKVDMSIGADELRSKLQEALNLLAKIATTVGECTVYETFGNSSLRAVAGHFIGIEEKVADLAADPIPF